MNIEEVITKKRNSLKTDRLDMSFGELINLYEEGDLFITPEYQRAFRWTINQQTRFIESVLLGIPIPPIFVAEDNQSKWEIVDGLQRISTIFAFFGYLHDLPEKNNTILTKGEMIPQLDGVDITKLPLKLRISLKRAVCRVEIVRWDSLEDMRYELFNRLNTGASPLSDQEIRNCIFRSYKVDLNEKLRAVAKVNAFNEIICPSDAKKEQMFLEELTLRFFAFKHLKQPFKVPVSEYLSEFMRGVSKGEIPFDLENEEKYLISFIQLLNRKMNKSVFRPNGNFALHLYDSIAYALPRVFPVINSKNADTIIEKITKLSADKEYQSIGTSTFSNTRIKTRMDRALKVFNGE